MMAKFDSKTGDLFPDKQNFTEALEIFNKKGKFFLDLSRF